MAELTHLESKLAEVLGLAQAAQETTEKVGKLVDDKEIQATLHQMKQEASETERRCTEIVEELDGKKTAVQEKARETRTEAREMMRTYLSDDVDGLDGLEFMMMAEAGELGHVEIVGAMNEQADDLRIQELVDWALPIQQQHVARTREAALTLASQEDANEPAG
jgi:hypothetical protein